MKFTSEVDALFDKLMQDDQIFNVYAKKTTHKRLVAKRCLQRWQKQHPEKVKEYQQRYYYANREKILAYNKKYYSKPENQLRRVLYHKYRDAVLSNRGVKTLTELKERNIKY